MKIGFYCTLAVTGIRKNKKLYYPYILTCICMIMMFYIICFLTYSGEFRSIPGGEAMQSTLSFGCGVIGIFSLIFLYYTNSFLIRRRKKEFGLYHILGMGKRNLTKILIWENILTAFVSLALGLISGFLLSKAADLLCVRLIGGEFGFSMHIEPKAIGITVLLFAGVFFLIMLRMLVHIYRSRPIELLQSESLGEKPPKANWMIAVLGVLLLVGAYYIALHIEEPVTAMMWFFVAVVMVIFATYLLFITGSVAFCRLLQKNKSYYYKTKHFVSLSSMVYRMKRNGAGLASICILSTMVLVMLSSTACLYIGADDSLRGRYPRDIVVDIYSQNETYVNVIQETVSAVLEEHEEKEEHILQYTMLDMAGYQAGDTIYLDPASIEAGVDMFEDIRQLFIIPLADYNRLMEKTETLKEDEVMIYMTKAPRSGKTSGYGHDTITLDGMGTWQVKKAVPEFVANGIDAQQVMSSLFIFVKDEKAIQQLYDGQAAVYGKNKSYMHVYYGFDLSCDKEKQIAITKELKERIFGCVEQEDAFPPVTVEGIEQERSWFYGLYGGLFFLGILLGTIFIFGTVLIMYYKQISEGYEDQGRFEILRKVGMRQKEIRQSVNSQVLTVFFLPLVMAGVHIAFAFPLISKMLLLFAITDKKLLLCITGICYVVFAIFYIVVYIVTSRGYYTIVSGKKERQ
ncbi:ABC transporter permease [Faecalicatena acetigenes]|uniref:ABC transporter permease n=1 Tax=Faecalicatena acetigenes TaxID=2981790 RepID=A0ABT2TAH6_9FIRM|nr:MULTISPECIES: ABC transporter permease [Lachnospiraceae]MCU6747284.1 ABC transporter permease [Faecalicatena acetigenes]SCH77728.1 FtsX-like permease family [uncultured Clostridium sp.]